MSDILSINAAALVKILQGMTPLAGSDSVPALHGVHLARRGGRVTVAATDRFRAAMTSEEVEWSDGVDEDWQVVLPMSLCKSIISTWKGAPRFWRITVAVEPIEDATRNEATVAARDALGSSIGGRVDLDAGFPKMIKILEEPKSAEPPKDTAFAFNYDYLLAFEKLRRHRGEQIAIVWPEQPSQPVRLTIGTHTVCIIMPTRIRESLSVDEILNGGAK